MRQYFWSELTDKKKGGLLGQMTSRNDAGFQRVDSDVIGERVLVVVAEKPSPCHASASRQSSENASGKADETQLPLYVTDRIKQAHQIRD